MTKRHRKELTAKELAALPDEEIDTSDIPELTSMEDRTRADAPTGPTLGPNFWKTARVVMPEERSKTQTRRE